MGNEKGLSVHTGRTSNTKPKKTIPERWKHINVFETYLLMGPGRTLRELSDATGIKLSTLKSWQQYFGWTDRLESRDRQAITQLQKDNEALYLETVKKRQIQAYQVVQEKALKQLSKPKVRFDNDKDAAIALDIGIKGEREAMGLRDTKLKAAIKDGGFAALVEAVMPG